MLQMRSWLEQGNGAGTRGRRDNVEDGHAKRKIELSREWDKKKDRANVGCLNSRPQMGMPSLVASFASSRPSVWKARMWPLESGWI
jgi:hypothetical protein